MKELTKRIRALRARLDQLLKKRARLRRERKRIEIINAHGAFGGLIVAEAKRAKLSLALACALVEKESDFRNIFGCDLGQRHTAPWCNHGVNKERVQELIRYVRSGGASNGIGLSQITSIGFIEEAEKLGGAHLPRNQLRVGFSLLRRLIDDMGKFKGIGAYNGGPGNPIDSYARDVINRERKWKRRFDG